MWVRVISLAWLALSGWYLFVAPSLELKRPPDPKTLQELTSKQVELAKLDLQDKIYPEIQKRLETREEWLIRKLTLAGGLLVAFLVYIWKPFGGERLEGITPRERRTRLEEDLPNFLTSRPICAALGLACVVSLFMDIHIRRSLLVILQLGTWAAEYGVPALGGDAENFPGWEQFIRGRKSGNEGMHFSLIDAIQTGDLNV